MKWTTYFSGLKESQVIKKLRSEDGGRRAGAERWLRQKYERAFSIEEEVYKIKAGPAGPSVVEEAFKSLFRMAREWEGDPGNLGLQGYFDRTLTERLAEVLNKGDYTAVFRAESYLAKRLAGFVEQRKFHRMLPQRHDREQAFSDALFALIRNLKYGKYKQYASLSTYFHTIYYRCCVGMLREKQKESSLPSRPWREADDLTASLDADALEKLRIALKEVDREELKQKLNLLKKAYSECYQILYLHEVYDMAYAEIARRMDSTADRIKARAWQCRKKAAALISK